jgi:DNA-binding NtrC family response regulator
LSSKTSEINGSDLTEQFERQYILRVLERVGWNVSRAARLLGVHRNTVLAKLSAWGIQRPSSADGRSLSL